ncbi:translocation protein Sec66 [Coemansia aciculifera]|uniref:Translocation protein Sec66 n=1 Tax=Coemansia aciculifera TaxID=417176 RepID=A0ACC1M085_9FUNG|nr:translocation protein Sec66 [Coemansia aciculifera]KAJ2910848.1 translocation protein Sec66 [Coemansia aciculifera]
MASGTGMLLVYIFGWGIVFGTFVHYYHKRKAVALAKLEAWYPTHEERTIYYSLVTLQKTNPSAVSNEVLKAALIRRAMTDIVRAVEVQANKATLPTLVKAGAMSEEFLHQFNAAEAELNAEMVSVVQEAERLQKGWGQGIMPAASEMINSSRLRELREEMLKQSFEAANCRRNAYLEDLPEKEREKATTDGTPENQALMRSDVLLSSIFNMPIGEAMKIAAAAHAQRMAATEKAQTKNGPASPPEPAAKEEQQPIIELDEKEDAAE